MLASLLSLAKNLSMSTMAAARKCDFIAVVTETYLRTAVRAGLPMGNADRVLSVSISSDIPVGADQQSALVARARMRATVPITACRASC